MTRIIDMQKEYLIESEKKLEEKDKALEEKDKLIREKLWDRLGMVPNSP